MKNKIKDEAKMSKKSEIQELTKLIPVVGVYAITNKMTGVSYIGQSKNIMSRWCDHVSQLVLGVHPNYNLQNDWIKYGASNFSARVILTCTKQDLLKQEQLQIKEFAKLAGVYNFVEKKN